MNKNELPKSYRRGRGIDATRGGYIEGRSHEQGGIRTHVRGGDDIEIEGTEYIISGKAVKALGTSFLDKLNATGNDYWPNIQGFNRGELPDANYEHGGNLNNQQPCDNPYIDEFSQPQQTNRNFDYNQCLKPYKCPGTSPCCDYDSMLDIPGKTHLGLPYEGNNPYMGNSADPNFRIEKPSKLQKSNTFKDDVRDEKL